MIPFCFIQTKRKLYILYMVSMCVYLYTYMQSEFNIYQHTHALCLQMHRTESLDRDSVDSSYLLAKFGRRPEFTEGSAFKDTLHIFRVSTFTLCILLFLQLKK